MSDELCSESQGHRPSRPFQPSRLVDVPSVQPASAVAARVGHPVLDLPRKRRLDGERLRALQGDLGGLVLFPWAAP